MTDSPRQASKIITFAAPISPIQSTRVPFSPSTSHHHSNIPTTPAHTITTKLLPPHGSSPLVAVSRPNHSMLNEELSTTSSTRYRTTNAVVKAEEEEGDDVNMSDVDVTDEILQEEQEEENEMESKPALHIEVRLKPTATVRYDLIRKLMWTHLDTNYCSLLQNSEIWEWDVPGLAENVERVWIDECSLPSQTVLLDAVRLHIHVYQPPADSTVTEFSTSAESEDTGESDVPAASIVELPSRSLEGVWDSLIYDEDVKNKLLGYIYSTLLFSDAMVDFNIVTWNRVVLLHGPPGTGKTSLCRALAQKLSIRLSDRYQHGKLVEINSHSLFSKWFSESGKLVQRLFSAVTEMVDDETGFVVVLIDEVESLTAARAGAMSGKEPSDALRVVNALLTQLDKLKHRKNCLVMTTSNLSAAIDGAFIDRADIKQYIGLPPAQAVYWILESCLKEIVRAKLISPIVLESWDTIKAFRESDSVATGESRKCSSLLYDLAFDCKGMSGRTLRRLPVLAHARHMNHANSMGGPVRMSLWLEAMKKCVKEEGVQMGKIEGGGI